MEFLSLRPIIWTEALQDTISFYTEVLGFTLGERNDDWGWASLYKGNTALMLSRPPQQQAFERAAFTGSFYFTIGNVAMLWEQLKDRCRVCYEIEEFEWGMREFAIYDNNGYILQFGQEL